MFAITATSFSPDDPLQGLALGDHPDPDPPPGWTVVRVRAASVNHHDLWSLRGVGLRKERLPIVLGCDASGVTEDGREVIVHAVISEADGDSDTLTRSQFSLLSERYDGTFAELVAVPRGNLIDKPPDLSFAEAACLPTAYLTVYRALFTRGGLNPGGRVLVQGAGGGTSTAAILLARAAGARVYVTSRSEEKLEAARELGAHETLAAGERLPERVDVVLDSVGEATWEHSMKSVRSGGTVVAIGATTGTGPPAVLNRLFFRHLRVLGSTMGTRGELESLVRFLHVTGVRPLIDELFPLTHGDQALARLASGDVFGKLVLTG